MRTDPEVNVIVFEIKHLLKKETVVEPTPTRAKDGIQMAWRAVQSKKGLRANQVRQIYAEWEPSPEDAAFIAATFPRVNVSFSFARPLSPEGWMEALHEAARTMHAAGTASAEAQASRIQGKTQLFPILRDYKAGDFFAQAVVHRPIAPELAVFLAQIGTTVEGNMGIEYAMQNRVESSSESIDDLFEEACHNLRAGLHVNAGEADGSKIFTFSHPSDMAASALCLPDFYDQVCSWFGQDKFFIAFTDPANLYVTAQDSPFTAKLRKAVENSDYWGAVALTPACYHLDAGGLTLVVARPKKE
jgi:hypothetical protein